MIVPSAQQFRLAASKAGFAALASSVLILGGCADNFSHPASTPLAVMSGVIHGGQSPIQASTVTLYVTNPAATGYGQAGTLIGTATTDVSGSFTIAPSATPATCPAGQQAYITAAGGYPSGSPALVNTSTLLMAALGDCANVNANTHVIVNEVTTVAAAYALSGFMKTTASASLFAANVSAPAANNGVSGSAAVTGGTAAAGLAHAFLNAATLANYSGGFANSLTANISAGGTTINGVVPTVEINTLGDILQTCVNGVTGNAGCTSLFGFTPSISGVAPTNTLQAMINLARNPYPSAAAMNATTGLLSLTSGSPAFLPVLSATPPDWSLAIVYKSAAVFSTSDYFIGMDGNDTVYAGTNATSAKIAGVNAYGLSTPSFAAIGTGTTTRQIAPDAVGNIWVANNATLLAQYSATTGTITNTYTYTGGDVYGVAVDKANNVWVGNAVGTSPNVTELAYPGYAINYTSTAAGTFEPVAVFIDSNQNIWTADYFTNGTMASVLANLTPAATPTYTTSGLVITPVNATFTPSTAIKPIGVVVDASGNAWYGIVGNPANTTTTTGVEEVTPSFTSSVITSLNPQAEVANATLGAQATGIPSIDGAGTIYLSDNIGAGALGIHAYSTVAVSSSDSASQVLSPPSGYLGCYLATSTTTTCGSGTSSAVYNPRETAVDSTGSVWADISTTGGLTQIIGLGAPSWPLLQTGKPGLSPGLTTVTPLP